jgi:hypothetical protein
VRGIAGERGIARLCAIRPALASRKAWAAGWVERRETRHWRFLGLGSDAHFMLTFAREQYGELNNIPELIRNLVQHGCICQPPLS